MSQEIGEYFRIVFDTMMSGRVFDQDSLKNKSYDEFTKMAEWQTHRDVEPHLRLDDHAKKWMSDTAVRPYAQAIHDHRKQMEKADQSGVLVMRTAEELQKLKDDDWERGEHMFYSLRPHTVQIHVDQVPPEFQKYRVDLTASTSEPAQATAQAAMENVRPATGPAIAAALLKIAA